MTRSVAASLLAFVLVAAPACEEAVPTAVAVEGGFALVILSGDNQTAFEHTQLPQPIVAQLLNSRGRAVKGQIVNFRALQGGGSVWAGSSVTDANGIVRDWWTLGSGFIRNLLEVRTIDPATGEQIVLGTVLANVVQLTEPRIECRFLHHDYWGPHPQTGVGCGSNNPPALVGSNAVVPMQVRVLNGDGTPIPRMHVDFYGFQGMTVQPVYAVTDELGVASLTLSVGTGGPVKELLVINEAADVYRYFEFRLGF